MAVAGLLGTSAFANGPIQAEFDACLAQLADDASGAACVVPIRSICLQVAGQGEVAAELACLNQSLASLTSWTDALVSDTAEMAALAPQVAAFRGELTGVCTGKMTGDAIGDRRDYALCQLAGTSALYRKLRGKDLLQ